MSGKRKAVAALGIVSAAALAAAAAAAFDPRPIIRRYTVNCTGVEGRIVHLSDLHSGSLSSESFAKIEALSPDIIVMTGDMFDDKRGGANDIASVFDTLACLTTIAPCYAVTGNHEERRRDARALRHSMEAIGIVMLDGCRGGVTVSFEEGGAALCGVSDRAAYKSDAEYAAALDFAVSDAKRLSEDERSRGRAVLPILLSHRPDYSADGGFYRKIEAPLVLSGHAHGGYARIPRLLDGLYAPGQGFFPEFAGGMRVVEGERGAYIHIISRGLDSRPIRPRIFNRPEIVSIDIKKT